MYSALNDIVIPFPDRIEITLRLDVQRSGDRFSKWCSGDRLRQVFLTERAQEVIGGEAEDEFRCPPSQLSEGYQTVKEVWRDRIRVPCKL